MAENEAAAPTAAPPEKSSSMRTILVAGVLLVVEAAAFIGVMMFVGGPAKVEATGLEASHESEEDQIVEVLALNDKLTNDKLGYTYIYPTEIYLQVKSKDAGWIQEELERFKNEIRAEVSAIWRSAEPNHFQEPKLDNLTRKVEALMRSRFEKDHGAREHVIHKAVIVSGMGFRIDR